jgi:hypothetical protein
MCFELYLWLKLLIVKTAEFNIFSHFLINSLSLKENKQTMELNNFVILHSQNLERNIRVTCKKIPA